MTAVALPALATLLPEAVAPLMPWAPDAASGRTPAPGTAAAVAAPEGEVEEQVGASGSGDAALDDEPEAGGQG